MQYFRRFYLDKEKDIVVDLFMQGQKMHYVLRTPNHHSGNLIRNLARLCELPLSYDDNGLFIIRGEIPCYIDASNQRMYIFRLGNTKVANIFPDGTVEMKASIPSISKTLMSQTKDYKLGIEKTIIKTYILEENKFRTDLHTHMNANLSPDTLIALGIYHQIRYPLYYIRKLDLKLSDKQQQEIAERRKKVEESLDLTGLFGKYLDRKIDDNTFINFADLLLNNPEDISYNIPHIRASLTILKDGQAVFTNLEKVYLYRYIFTKGIPADEKIVIGDVSVLDDEDIISTYKAIERDHQGKTYKNNTLFQDKLLWIARGYKQQGIQYIEISDTTLVKKKEAVGMLKQVHEVMPDIRRETGVKIRFLAAIRRIPLTLVRNNIDTANYLNSNLAVLRVIAQDPYVAGCDFVGEEINSILDLEKAIREVVRIAKDIPSFVIRIHAGENDSLKNNVSDSIRLVRESLAEGQKMPMIRVGHGLYTENLKSAAGRRLLKAIRDNNVILEFQITSNVRLNNLNSLDTHPLRSYLAEDIKCVQGSDGAALYGTCSIDEQLSLEKLLDLRSEDQQKLKAVEREVMEFSRRAFNEKNRLLKKNLNGRSLEEYYGELLEKEDYNVDISLLPADKDYSSDALKDRLEELPDDRMPLVIVGGSFNNDRRTTKMTDSNLRMIDLLIERLDPSRTYVVIGHKLEGYERYFVEKSASRFDVYAVIPFLVSHKEKNRIEEYDVKVRICPEISGMGTYKSFNYEIFERRDSVVILFDGNAAALNLLQEARNGKARAHIFVNESSGNLRNKARSLRGYVTLFSKDRSAVDEIVEIINGTDPQ